MPTVLRVGPYRFFFYAGGGEEPPHVHVERDDNIAKFWLDPIRLKSGIEPIKGEPLSDALWTQFTTP